MPVAVAATGDRDPTSPCCCTSTCATLPADVEARRYGPRLSALVGMRGSTFPLTFSKTQALLEQLLGSRFGGIVVSDRFSAYHHLPIEQRQLCWAQQKQLFSQWHQYKSGAID